LRPFCTTEDFEVYRQLLKSLKAEDPLAALFQRLVPFHLHFGYRVINEISRFVVLASKQLLDFDVHQVIDVQILQKVLPKLHGTRGKLLRPLEDILAFCYEKPAGDGNDAERRKMAVAFDPAARYPRTAQKVGRMLADLEEQGYTSFIQ
jgi:hypothetical protein